MVYPYSYCDKKSFEYRRVLGKKKYSNYIRRGYIYNIYDMIASEVKRILKKSDRLDSEI